VPQAGFLGESHLPRINKLRTMLAQTATVHATITSLMAREPWDFAAVYYEGIDRFGHEFMEFHPPQMEHVAEEDFEAYRHCMEGIYRFHDMMFETLLTLAGDDAVVILMSDHGYYNDHLRPDPREGRSNPVEWHRPFGILAARGPGVVAGAKLYGATLLDVAPTVLEILGVPPGEDMPGRVLLEMFEEGRELQPRVVSWEEIDGDSGMHPADLRVEPAEAQAMLEQLVGLGYIEAPSDDARRAVDDVIACNQINLAESLNDSLLFDESIEMIERLESRVRDAVSTQLLLAHSLLGAGKRDRARTLLETLVSAHPQAVRVRMMFGALELAEGRTEEALAHLQAVAASDPRLPGVHNKLGEIYLGAGRNDLACDAFEQALQIDVDSPLAYAGRARARYGQGNYEGALDDGMRAAELVHFLPRAHLVVGQARLALGDAVGAIEALELALRQAPRLKNGWESLADAHRARGDAAKAFQAELKAKGI
ncbi:MAG: tetratricopeptide repeat protein, partial [Planctomycetales bacterium]|nr:tetratricopeptide repeat protein [Planctomycetales bacterium]